MRLVGCGIPKLYRQRLQRWHQLFIFRNIKQGCRILLILSMPEHFSAILWKIRILVLLLLIIQIGLLQYLLCNQRLGLGTSFLILFLYLSAFAYNIRSLGLLLLVLHGSLSNLWLNGAPYHLILFDLVVDLLDFVLRGMIQRNQVVLLRLQIFLTNFNLWVLQLILDQFRCLVIHGLMCIFHVNLIVILAD